jgi:D-inositol-3-phosphate glycosyltransferase
VPRVMHAADLAVQPSHFEALGLSAIEALACGVPVVASAVGGLLDFVVDGVNGKTCAPHDPADLARSLQVLVDDDELRRRFAERARASVERDYDERVVFAQFAAIMRQVARNSAGR